MKIPKCKMSVTGKHKFIDTSYTMVNTFRDYHDKWQQSKTFIKEKILCEYCKVVDDRKLPPNKGLKGK